MGEYWNKNSGGNSDCAEAVYSAGKNVITYSGNAGNGWGNVIIIEHRLKEGPRVQTLYGHLEAILVEKGPVAKRDRIGTIGNAGGKYRCHLHFELRDESSRGWDRVFTGYSDDRRGWLDPSDFIDRRLYKPQLTNPQ